LTRQASEAVQGLSSHFQDYVQRNADVNLRDYVPKGNLRNACPLQHTSKLSMPELVISKSAVKSHSKADLDQLKQFTVRNYEQYMMADPGKEHYTLWHYLTSNFHSSGDCRHVVDIGTRYTASALALGATGIPVKTFDIAQSRERFQAFRGKTETEWQQELQSTSKVNMEFKNLDLLSVPDNEFVSYMSTWLIILDTFHKPYSAPFEREWLARLVNMEPKFEGVVMLDDIHLNPEMRQWWKEVQDNATNWGYIAHDLTSVGHISGTGLLDFSGGKVSIVE